MTTLLDIWMSNKDFIETKNIDQIISMTGDGKLKHENQTSLQFRKFISNIPSSLIERFVEECLIKAYPQGGLILQDLVNEIGQRLGFKVEQGYYRGAPNRIGFDGIWRNTNGYAFIIEVKTTDAYQINLDTYADYRKKLLQKNQISNQSSTLFVVGRIDTGGLEAQVRGSKHPGGVSIISVDALLKLMHIKENLYDNSTITQIQEVLKPHDYTRVDRLIDIIFRTSEDIQKEVSQRERFPDLKSVNDNSEIVATIEQANYHDECIEEITKHLQLPFVKQGKCKYINSSNDVRLVCVVSKEYLGTGIIGFWYAFHASQKEFLTESRTGYIAFGCGSSVSILLIPSSTFLKYLPNMRKTLSKKRDYWHVDIYKVGNKYLLSHKNEKEGINITEYLLPFRSTIKQNS